ncbi:copper oxidase, partial [Brasilonema bromeliae SPC951]|nr:copper oxidase [Brasilonema bromeliae SPC951]
VRALGKGGHNLAAEVERIAATSGEVPAPNASTESDMSSMEGM